MKELHAAWRGPHARRRASQENATSTWHLIPEDPCPLRWRALLLPVGFPLCLLRGSRSGRLGPLSPPWGA